MPQLICPPQFNQFCLAGWDKHVKIAAINCAQQQECADYDIRGTPTIRAFYPNTPAAEGNIGENINLELHTADYLKGEVLRRMASMQTQGQSKPDMPSLQYYS